MRPASQFSSVILTTLRFIPGLCDEKTDTEVTGNATWMQFIQECSVNYTILMGHHTANPYGKAILIITFFPSTKCF